MADVTAGRVRSAAEVAEARAYGLTHADLGEWGQFAPIEIYWAVKHDVTPEAALRWAAAGLRVGDAVRAIALGMTPDEGHAGQPAHCGSAARLAKSVVSRRKVKARRTSGGTSTWAVYPRPAGPYPFASSVSRGTSPISRVT